MVPAESKNQPAPAISNSDATRWQTARQGLVSGRAAESLPAYQRLTKSYPSEARLWFECGLAAVAALEFDLARRAFQQAAQLAPADVDMLIAVAQQYHRLRLPELARVSFEAAAKANPSSVHAALSLAAWLERERNLDAAWQLVEETLARHPNHPSVLYYRAFLLHRKQRPAEAEPILRDLVKKEFSDANLKISCAHLLAVVLDELGQYADALICLRECKSELRRAPMASSLEHVYDNGDRARRQLLAGLTPEMIARWRRDTPDSALPHPLALLGGHPRSGTTLLEQILDAHPGVLAFDESEAFAAEIWDQLAPSRGLVLSAQALDALSPSRCSALRGRYFKSLFRELNSSPAGKILIDKNPAPTAALHFWLRMFPAAKVIIALRDPRDVVLSCYFQQLTLTPINVNFLSLERAARHYANLMDVWLRLRDLGGFDWIETRYEDFVGDVEKEGRRVNNFLGLEWHPDQARSHETARRKLVFSPTYADVVQPAHNRAIGRWKRYEEALAPIQSILAPYCKTFGY